MRIFKSKSRPKKIVLPKCVIYKKIGVKYYAKCNCGNKFTTSKSSVSMGRRGERVIWCKDCQNNSLHGNFVGKKFGSYTVLKQIHDTHSKKLSSRSWLAKCDCGNEEAVSTGNLFPGRPMGCPKCNSQSRLRTRKCRNKYGFMKNKLATLRRACTGENNQYYKAFGSGVLSVGKEWKNYRSFCKWGRKNGLTRGKNVYLMEGEHVFCPENCFVGHQTRLTPYKNPKIVPVAKRAVMTFEKVSAVSKAIEPQDVTVKKLKKPGLFSRIFKKIKWLISCLDGKAA